MSSGEETAAQFPIRFADIIFAEILDPNGQNLKTRRVVVLTPDIALAAGFPIVVAIPHCGRWGDWHAIDPSHR